jgi:hypothetical protein
MHHFLNNALGNYIYLRLQASDTELPIRLGDALLLKVGTLVLSYGLYNNTIFWFTIQ